MGLKIWIILNPRAGSADQMTDLGTALACLPGTEIWVTQWKGHAEELARRALEKGVDLVVAAGGDGTLNEVVNGLAADFGRARLGLLPLGTGNDFARTINVPADPKRAMEILLEGRSRRIDVVRAAVGGKSRWFLNVSAGGFGGLVSERAHEAKERWGPLAYMRAAVDVLPELKAFETSILLEGLDGTERLRVDTYNVVVSNGRYVAAGIPVEPRAEVDDGLLDVMIAPATTIPQLALLVPKVLLGQHLDDDRLIFRRAARIELESDPPMTFNVDGEILGEGEAGFAVQPRALEMVVGPEESGR